MCSDAMDSTERRAHDARMSDTAARRLPGLDVLRGLLLVLMALDHAGFMVGRFHSQELWAGAWTRYDSALPFLTRVVTHVCAPGFFLLMGASLVLRRDAQRRQGVADARIVREALIRGALLLVVATLVEVPAFLAATISGPSTRGNPDFAIPGMTEPRWVLTVLYALGVSMIGGALLLRARAVVWAAAAVAALGVTAVTTPGPDQFATDFGFLRTVLLLSRWSHGVWAQYPFVPWFGTALLGMLLGQWLVRDRAQCLRQLPAVGLAALVVAVALRTAGGFGNLRAPRDGSWMEFLNVIKYPPSLVFTLLTVGLNLLLLSAIEQTRAWGTRAGAWLQGLGQSPLAFYVAHLWLFATVGAVWFRQGAGYGTVYLLWVLALMALTAFTHWYRDAVASRPQPSIWRYF